MPRNAPILNDLSPARRPYQPSGQCERFFYCHDPEVLISGPAGTGKSRACLEKLFACATKYAGMRGLIVRKTRESLTESGLVTWEDKVVPENHPILRDGGQRKMRQSYQFDNGSCIVVGGMDKASKTLSTEFDLIYVQEAIELTQHDWEMLTRPLRNGVMPYQQIIADTNPDAPTHWLRKRCDGGKTTMIESRHEDNPTIWDHKRQCWTDAGAKYIAKLDNLTGPRKMRLRHGRWVQAEGVVYEGWDRQIHLIDRFKVPSSWPRFWSIDFGFTNPFVWQLWAKDPDGRLYLIRQIYHTKRLVEEHAARIKELALEELSDQDRWSAGPGNLGRHRPQCVLCDHDAEGRATLAKYLQVATMPAKKEIVPGIQAVASRLQVAGDGKPRLFILRDSLADLDPELADSRRPVCTEDEFESYIWKPQGVHTTDTKNIPDEPIDKDNHGMDALRYLVAHFETFGNSVPRSDMYNERERRPESPWKAEQSRESHSRDRGMYGRNDRGDDDD